MLVRLDLDLSTLSWDGEQRLVAWGIAIAQCPNTLAVATLEDRLHRRLDMLRNREAPCGVERDALHLCAQRRAELIAAGPSPLPPSAPGGIPALSMKE